MSVVQRGILMLYAEQRELIITQSFYSVLQLVDTVVDVSHQTDCVVYSVFKMGP